MGIRLTNGACVRLHGTLTQSIGSGQDVELQVDQVELLGECNPDVRYYCLPDAALTDTDF